MHLRSRKTRVRPTDAVQVTIATSSGEEAWYAWNIYSFPHIQIDTQTKQSHFRVWNIKVANNLPDGNDRREEDQESENTMDVPLSSEAV